MTGRVLITGAGARVGRHLAKGLAAKGWAVALHYNRSQSGAQVMADEIIAAGGKAAIVQANLNVPAQLNSLITRASEALGGPLTALINNASTFEDDRAQDVTRTVYEHHMGVNLYAPLALSRDFAAQTDRGVILNLLDQRVLRPAPDHFTYTISKAALYSATQTMAQSYAPGIRVNAIGPGPTLKNSRQDDDAFNREATSTLLGAGSPPDTLLDAAIYLLGASSVTGQMIAVDGGQHLNYEGQLHV